MSKYGFFSNLKQGKDEKIKPVNAERSNTNARWDDAKWMLDLNWPKMEWVWFLGLVCVREKFLCVFVREWEGETVKREKWGVVGS